MLKKRYKCSYCLKIFQKKNIYELSSSCVNGNSKIKKVFICSKCLVEETIVLNKSNENKQIKNNNKNKEFNYG